MSAQAAVTGYDRLGVFNTRHAFLTGSGGWRLKIKVPAASLPGLQESCLRLRPHMVEGRERSCSPASLLIRTVIPSRGLQPHDPDLTTSQRLHLLSPSQGGVGFPQMNLWGTHTCSAEQHGSIKPACVRISFKARRVVFSDSFQAPHTRAHRKFSVNSCGIKKKRRKGEKELYKLCSPKQTSLLTFCPKQTEVHLMEKHFLHHL